MDNNIGYRVGDLVYHNGKITEVIGVIGKNLVCLNIGPRKVEPIFFEPKFSEYLFDLKLYSFEFCDAGCNIWFKDEVITTIQYFHQYQSFYEHVIGVKFDINQILFKK